MHGVLRGWFLWRSAVGGPPSTTSEILGGGFFSLATWFPCQYNPLFFDPNMSKFLSPSFEDNQGSTFAFAYGFYDWPLGSLAHSPRPWSRGRATSGRWGRCRSWGTCRRGWASRALLEAKREAILKLGFMMLGWGVSYKYKIYINGVNKNIMHIYIYLGNRTCFAQILSNHFDAQETIATDSG